MTHPTLDGLGGWGSPTIYHQEWAVEEEVVEEGAVEEGAVEEEMAGEEEEEEAEEEAEEAVTQKITMTGYLAQVKWQRTCYF